MITLSHRCGSERGAVLATSLIFLVTLTLLGLTAMQTTSLEQKMSGNMQELHQAFHGAESGIAAALSNAGSQLLDTSGTISYDVNDIPGLTIQTETAFKAQGEQPPAGYSLSGQFTSYYFRIDSEAEAGGASKSTHQQGFYIVGPKPDASN